MTSLRAHKNDMELKCSFERKFVYIKKKKQCRKPCKIRKNSYHSHVRLVVQCGHSEHIDFALSAKTATWFENTKMSPFQVTLLTLVLQQRIHINKLSLRHRWKALNYLHGQQQNGSISVGRCA